MKRSVNFSAPRQFALMAAMRNAVNEEWLADMSAETRQRFDADYQILKDAGAYPLAIDLSVMIKQVTKSEPHKCIGDLLYSAFDAGWRTGNGGFIMPDGTSRKAPTKMWHDAMYAIEYAAKLRMKIEAQS